MHFTILRPPEKQDGVPASELSLIAFPTADLFGRKINDFDLIIFDRYSNQTLLPSVYFDNIVAYVENGGAFLAAVGPDYATLRGLYYSPLESILPARPDGALFEQAFRAHVSKDGEKHPVTRGLEGSKTTPPSWGEWFRQVEHQCAEGRQRAARRRGQAVGRALARGQGARRHVADRSAVAVGARFRRRRPACRSDAAHGPLADEGARTRRGSLARDGAAATGFWWSARASRTRRRP